VNEQEISRVAARTVDTLARLTNGMLLAVWEDGTVTPESPGFAGRRDGGRITQPVETFAAGSLMSFHEVQTRLLVAYRGRGLMN
jgi:hypothetical protein